MLEAGLTLGSAGVAGAVLAVLQKSGRGPLLKKLSNMKLIQAIRSKKGGGGRSGVSLRAVPSRALGADDDGGFVRAIGIALGQSLSVGTLTVNQNRLAGQLLMGIMSPGAWNEEDQAAVHASLESEQGAGLVAKRIAAASVAEKFKDGSACAKILSSKLTAENLKACPWRPRGSRATRCRRPGPPCTSSCRRALDSVRMPD
jgi:hypothetical protein